MFVQARKSTEAIERLNRVLAGGVGSGGRVDHRSLFVKSGKGPRITDADGNSYIDYMMGFGALILGHRPTAVMAAIERALQTGTMFGAACDAELELAEKVVDCLPCANLARFTSSGTEAVMAVLRLARAATGRDKVLKFEGHFHGWADSIYVSVKPTSLYGLPTHPTPLRMTAGQPKSVLDDITIAPWNDLPAFERILDHQGRDIAAVILEPYPTNNGCMESGSAYLIGVRDLCTRYGIVLIFDEVVSGFRMGLSGAQGHYGVTPDLCTFGKAMAGGMPIAGFAGRRDLMGLLEGNQVAHLGTYNSNAISAAAAIATIGTLAQDQGAAFTQIIEYGLKLIEGFNEIFTRHNLPCCAAGHGAVLTIFAANVAPKTFRETLTHKSCLIERIHRDLLKEGVWIFGRGNLMIGNAHGSDEMAETLEKMDIVVRRIAKEGMWV